MEFPTLYELGVDEVGRGCFFGPVVAAAVVLPLELNEPEWRKIKDSKKLSEKKRLELTTFIKQHALVYHIAECSHQEIDQINILQASLKAMTRAVHGCYLQSKEKELPLFEKIYVDGNHFKPYVPPGEDSEYIPYECIEQGDNKRLSIASASILAKTYRDQWIQEQCRQHPVLDRYDLQNNKGYGTKNHMNALKEYGPIEGHRLTYRPVAQSLAATKSG